MQAVPISLGCVQAYVVPKDAGGGWRLLHVCSEI